MKRLLTILFCAAFFVACSTDLDTEVTTGNIVGSVVDKTTGEQIPVASISLNPSGKTTVTGSDGTFEFNDIDPGEYTISVKKEGYNFGENTVMVVAGKNTECHILMERIPVVVTADRDELDFGVSVTTLAFSIVNSGYEDLEWSVEYDKSLWIKEIKPSSGVLPYGKTAAIVVSIDRTKLKEGDNEMVIVIVSTNGKSEIRAKAVGEKRALPKLNVLDATNVTSKSATFNAKIIDVGAPSYEVRGFVYSLNEMPSFDNMISKFTAPVTDDAEFSYNVNGLTLGETYYVRAFATNEIGTEYSSNQISFTTKSSAPEVTIDTVSNFDVTNASVVFNGTVKNVGDPAYTEKGFVYSLSNTPTTTDSKIWVGGVSEGVFNAKADNLQLDQTYYVRAYIINSQGTYYSSEEKIFKVETTLPKVCVEAVSNHSVEAQTVTLNGRIENEGAPAYYERGFVYGLINNPTIQDAKVIATGSGIGEYSANIHSLERNKTYYVRAYAINKGGISYSEEQVQFILQPTFPIVDICEVSNKDVIRRSVVLNGNVTNVGDPKYTEKGFVYNSTSNPTIDDKRIIIDGNEAGAYSYLLTELDLDKMYYVKAYVISEGVVYYSEQQQSFILATTSPSPKMISITGTSYSAKRAKLTGQITSEGEPPYSMRGFVYGYNSNPTIEDNYVVVDGEGTSSFSVTISNLATKQKYYVRAFAEQNGKYFYSNEIDFTLEPIQAQVGDTSVSDIGTNTARLSSTIGVVGDPIYSEKGFVYHTDSNPTINSNKDIIIVSGSNAGSFSAIISNLSSNTTYYTRAYVIQNGNIYYSSVKSFKTTKLNSVVNTNNASEVMYTTAMLNGTIASVGDPRYEQRGFYYGTNSSPTSNNSNTFIEDASTSGSYKYKVSGLKEGTKYYFRAFVIQPGDTNPIMGDVLSFTTGHAPNVTTGGVINISCSGSNEASLNWSVTLYGGLSDVGNPAFTEFGFVYGKKNQPSVNDGTSAYTTTSQFDWSGDTRVFYVGISGLLTGQHYYIRAVAKTPLGYVYGEQVEFTPSIIAPAIRTYSTECQYIDGTGWAASFVGVAGSLGQPAATGLGFVYGLESMPTVGDGVSKAVSYTKIETQNGYRVYGVAVTGLQAGKEYYVRTYAKTPLGYTYGETLVFRTY